MARLIDADELERWLEMGYANANPLDYIRKATFAECLAKVKASPTIDVEPVRHGRWGASTIVGYDGIYVIYARPCLECGHEDRSFVAIYCPNCGAKMDGGAEK